MKKQLGIYILFCGLILILGSCNLEKEISIELPPYDGQVIVECYLEPGKPYNLLLTKSTGFFDPLQLDPTQALADILLQNAEVKITHEGNIYELNNTLGFNPVTATFSNYSLPTNVPFDFDSNFDLEINTAEGDVITATTRLLPSIPFDSIVVEFLDTDTLARVLTYLTDDPDTTNYFRRQLHHTRLDSFPLQDFLPTDEFNDNNTLLFGTAFEFEPGDTIINTVFHIELEYHAFLNSLFLAQQANGNPFAQPSTLNSNVFGDNNPIGIFTGLSYARDTTIIQN